MIINKDTNVTFVFKNSRDLKSKQNDFPKEHFYSYFYFARNYKNTSYIEMKDPSNILKFLFKTLRKLTNKPIYLEYYLNFESLKKLNKTEILIITNQNQFYYIYPILKFIKIFKNVKVLVFVMGLNENFNYKNNTLRNVFFKNIDKLMFLSKNEQLFYLENFPKYKNKFHYIPFGVDKNFWKPSSDLKQKGILFVGNDQNRDIKLLISLVNSLPELEFNIVSSNPELLNLKNKNNVNLYQSDWQTNKISDLELKKIMENNLISIIPLKNTLQPSGQSVALQSMSLKIPVIISKTDGFWDEEKFQHNKNLIFIDDNNIHSWKKAIVYLFKNSKVRNEIAISGNNTVNNYFSDIETYLKLEKIINQI